MIRDVGEALHFANFSRYAASRETFRANGRKIRRKSIGALIIERKHSLDLSERGGE